MKLVSISLEWWTFLVLASCACIARPAVAIARASETSQPSAWFGIMSAPDNFDKRRAIRNTWMKDPWVKRSKVQFVIGKSSYSWVNDKVSREGKWSRDILHVDMRESYRALVWKTAMLLQAGVKSKAQWIIKIDDDVVPRLWSISQTLGKHSWGGWQRYRYAGHFLHNMHAIRNPNSKWYVPYYVYPEDIFPKYASGPFYALSRGLAKLIAVDRFKELWYNPIMVENVTVGKAVKRVSYSKNVEYVDLHVGTDPHTGAPMLHGCKPGVWSQWYHDIKPAEMECMWRRNQLPPMDICCPYMLS